MSEKRRDAKGRILKNGEVQRQDGKYMFRYTDENGDRQTIYSWRLVETDKTPAGKKSSPALRTMIAQIEKDIGDGIHFRDADDITLNNLFDTFMETRTDLKSSTRCNYLCLYKTHVAEAIGERAVGSIRYSDIQKFYLALNQKKNLRISTIRAINSVIWQILESAVRDDIIRRNPADGVMRDVGKKLKEESEHKNALTIEQQERFIDYILSSSRYSRYSALFITLLGTGLRIGETLGLRWCDVDFRKELIYVDHSLSYKDTESGGYQYHINPTKTKAGIRTVPMFQDVKRALHGEKRKRKHAEYEPFTVDGYTDFIFLNANGKVYTPATIFDKIQIIVADYNREECAKARAENREPCIIPRISAHILRHTFCTRMCETDTNIKVIQDVMGHKNIRTTMDVYNEATMASKVSSFKSLEGAIYLGGKSVTPAKEKVMPSQTA